METFSALLAICAGNSPVTGEFPTQRPVTRSFDVYFDLCPNERLSKQSWGWWFETLSRSLWRHRNVNEMWSLLTHPKFAGRHIYASWKIKWNKNSSHFPSDTCTHSSQIDWFPIKTQKTRITKTKQITHTNIETEMSPFPKWQLPVTNILFKRRNFRFSEDELMNTILCTYRFMLGNVRLIA